MKPIRGKVVIEKNSSLSVRALVGAACLGVWLYSMLAIVDCANAQSATATPTSLSLDPTSPICSGGSTTQKACVTLPDKSTVNKVDIFFLFDDTGSFAGFVPTVTDIFSGLVSGLEAALPGVEFGFGVGRFEDYGGPGSAFSFENSSGRPFVLNQPIVTAADAGGASSRDSLISAALARTAPGYGGDGPESSISEGLYQVAAGTGFDGDGDSSTTGLGGLQPAGSIAAQVSGDGSGDVPAFSTLDSSVVKSGSVGGAGFRPDALKLVILATDICSVAAFSRSLGIPTSISGNGDTEDISEFACSSTTPGSSRFGFVSDSKSVQQFDEVAPAGAHTVPETVAALNAAGVRVLGMVPGTSSDATSALVGAGGAGVPKGSGPSFSPAVFLSALARLTGGTDSTGEPLVFNIGDGGTVLQDNITASVLAAATKPIDVTVVAPDLTSSNVSLDGVSPTVAFGIAPGGQACFDVTLNGSGSGFATAFGLSFIDASSELSLAKIPVSVNCVAGEISCTAADQSGRLNALDGAANSQRDSLIRASKQLAKFGGSAASLARSLRKQAADLYATNWTLTYTLPATTQSCTSSPFCSTVSSASTVSSYLSNAKKLHDLTIRAIKELKKRHNSSRDTSRRTKEANALYQNAVSTAAGVPAETSSCSSAPLS